MTKEAMKERQAENAPEINRIQINCGNECGGKWGNKIRENLIVCFTCGGRSEQKHKRTPRSKLEKAPKR